MLPGILRLKLVVAEQWRWIIGTLVVIGVLTLAGGGWVYTHPPVEHVTEDTDVQTIQTDVETSALVTGNSSLWARGDRIEGIAFFPAAAPALRIRATTTVPEGQSVPVAQEITLVYEVTRDDTTIWRSSETIARSDREVSSGQAELTGTVDTRTVHDTRRRINRELTGIGTTDVRLRVNTSYETDKYTGRFTEATTLTVAQNGYWLNGPLDSERTHSRSVSRKVTRPPDMTTVTGLAVLSLLSFLAAGIVWVARNRLPEPSIIRDQLEQSRYAEWISTVDFGGELPDRRLRLRTLGGLVNLGIDSNKRVFYDPDRGLYGVIDGEVLYYYVETGGKPLDSSGEDQWEWPFEEPDDTTPETPPSNLQRIE